MLVIIGAVLLSSSLGVPMTPEPWQSRGELKADVVIHTYMDYQCRYCRQQWAVMERVVNRDSGLIRWVNWLWPNGNERSKHFAKVGYCVGTHYGASAFSQFSQRFFALPSSLHNNDDIAMRISLQIPNTDKTVIENCLTANETSAYLTRVEAFAQNNATFAGTPGIIIQVNETHIKLQGFQSSQSINASIKKAASHQRL